MNQTAYALTLAIVFGFGLTGRAIAQVRVPAAPPRAPAPAAPAPTVPVPVPVAPEPVPPPLGPVSATATGDVQNPQYDVVTSANDNPMIVGGTPDMIARTELVGLWRAVHLEQNGVANPALAEQLHMRFYPGRVALMQTGRPTIDMAYRLETRHDPHHFSWFIRPAGLIVMQRGVYWLTGDKLLLCLGSINERRASAFLTAPGDGRTLFILERVQPAGAPRR